MLNTCNRYWLLISVSFDSSFINTMFNKKISQTFWTIMVPCMYMPYIHHNLIQCIWNKKNIHSIIHIVEQKRNKYLSSFFWNLVFSMEFKLYLIYFIICNHFPKWTKSMLSIGGVFKVILQSCLCILIWGVGGSNRMLFEQVLNIMDSPY